jgi:hypothetical protein
MPSFSRQKLVTALVPPGLLGGSISSVEFPHHGQVKLSGFVGMPIAKDSSGQRVGWEVNSFKTRSLIDGQPIQGLTGGNGWDRRVDYALTSSSKPGEVIALTYKLIVKSYFISHFIPYILMCYQFWWLLSSR